MLIPPESAQYWLGLVSPDATVPRASVALDPGSGATSRSAVEDLLQTCSGEVKVPDRQTTVAEVIEFSLAAIHEFTSADVLPLAEENVTVHELGGAMGEPVGVAGLGMSPSPSAGTVPCGSMGNELAVTGGVGWVMVAGTNRGAALATVAGASASAMSGVVTAAMAERASRMAPLFTA